MTKEVIHYLGCDVSRQGRLYLDGTFGGGGHSLAILEASAGDTRLIALDKDEEAITRAEEILESFKGRIEIVKEDFANLRAALDSLGIDKVDGILLDLGVSSFQLDSPERGFSFRHNARLDMRMDQSIEQSAFEVVNEFNSEDLQEIFSRYGEEPRARTLAKAIVKAREAAPIETTGELAKVIEDATPDSVRYSRKRRSGGKSGGRKIHPATKVFQAIRIFVNKELQAIESALRDGLGALNKGGRMVVISFHSLEDRLVKRAFKEWAISCTCPPRSPKCMCEGVAKARLLTKKSVVASTEEVEANPRARSARLRAIEKL
jgi:16S rRNA (cytosine1402-N4)-methyltransferase